MILVAQKEGLVLRTVVNLVVAKILLNLYRDVKDNIKSFVVNHTNNQFILKWIAKNDKNSENRIEAIGKIVDIHYLSNLLSVEKNPKIRFSILEKLPPNYLVRLYAMSGTKIKREISKIDTSQDAYYKMLREESDPELAKEFLQKISDPDKLELLKNHSLEEVRSWVDKKLKWVKSIKENGTISEKALATVLKYKKLDPYLKKILKYIHQPKMWYQIAKKHMNSKVRILAIDNLEGNQTLLLKIVTDQKLDMKTRLRALQLLKDPEIMNNLVLTDPNWEIRLQALAMLNPKRDQEILTKVTKYEKNQEVLCQLILKTKNQEDLKILDQRIDPKEFQYLAKILKNRELALKEGTS